MKKTNTKVSLKKVKKEPVKQNNHQKQMASMKKTIDRLEKKILLLQVEISKKQDKKITVRIRRSAIYKHIQSFIPQADSGLSKILNSKSVFNA